MLNCCESLEIVKTKGITMPKLGCLAYCNGANVTLNYGDQITIEDFRRDLEKISKVENEHHVMIVSYSRKTFQQSGGGHFSPIGAYNPSKDMALIFDVARFKYPPHWVPVTLLFESLQTIDAETKKSRGYLLLSASSRMYSQCACNDMKEEIACEMNSQEQVVEKIERLLNLPMEGGADEKVFNEFMKESSAQKGCSHCMKSCKVEKTHE
jgi:hypothetical protein